MSDEQKPQANDDVRLCSIHDVEMHCDEDGNWRCYCCFADQEYSECQQMRDDGYDDA
jgi:hypothetical protein